MVTGDGDWRGRLETREINRSRSTSSLGRWDSGGGEAVGVPVSLEEGVDLSGRGGGPKHRRKNTQKQMKREESERAPIISIRN